MALKVDINLFVPKVGEEIQEIDESNIYIKDQSPDYEIYYNEPNHKFMNEDQMQYHYQTIHQKLQTQEAKQSSVHNTDSKSSQIGVKFSDDFRKISKES